MKIMQLPLDVQDGSYKILNINKLCVIRRPVQAKRRQA